MFQRLAAIIGAGTDVAKAEAEVARRRALRLAVGLGSLAGCAIIATMGIGTLGGAAVIALIPSIGLAPSLAAVGGGLVLVAAVAMWAIVESLGSISNRTLEDARRDAARARRLLHEKATPSPEPKPRKKVDETSSPLEDAFRYATNHPELVGGAAFALTSVLGVRRTIRWARFAAGPGSLIAGIIARNGSENGKLHEEGPTPTHADTPPRSAHR